MDKMNVPDNVLPFFLAIKLFASLYEHNSNNNHGEKILDGVFTCIYTLSNG